AAVNTGIFAAAAPRSAAAAFSASQGTSTTASTCFVTKPATCFACSAASPSAHSTTRRYPCRAAASATPCSRSLPNASPRVRSDTPTTICPPALFFAVSPSQPTSASDASPTTATNCRMRRLRISQRGYERAPPARYDRRARRTNMKYGARNQIQATVKSVKKGDVMSLVKFEIAVPAEMASVLTTESLEDLGVKKGDKLLLVVKAIHVLPVKP